MREKLAYIAVGLLAGYYSVKVGRTVLVAGLIVLAAVGGYYVGAAGY